MDNNKKDSKEEEGRKSQKTHEGRREPPSDEEVDQFFAIVRRVHQAKASGSTWKPEFLLEDFGEKETTTTAVITSEAGRKGGLVIDLNELPDSGEPS